MNRKTQQNFDKTLKFVILTLGLGLVLLPIWYMIITSFKPQTMIFELPPRLWPQGLDVKELHRSPWQGQVRSVFSEQSQSGDIAWLDPDGKEMTDETWNAPHVRCLGVRLDGEAIAETTERGERIIDDTLLMLANAHDERVPFTLPPTPAEARWVAVLDTARVQRDLRKLLAGDQYLLESRSLAVFRLSRQRPLANTRA